VSALGDEGGDSSPARAGSCLITGASGFIGGHLAARLVRDGWQVRCLVRPTSDTSQLDGLDAEIIRGDLNDAVSLIRAVDGCRVVFHCGALVSDWALVDEIARVNVRGTEKMAAAAVSGSVERFVHFSTTDVYGNRTHERIDESYRPDRFSNWYAQTKLDAESTIWRAREHHGLPAVILRPATVYGPRSQEIVGEIADALRKGNMLLIDGGRAVAGLVYIENLVDAAVLAAGHTAATGHAFNVTDGLEVTWRRFTDDLARGLGCPPARWSVPYAVANALALPLEQGYRLLHATTGIKTRPLLSRQAVHVLGNNQRFSNDKIRTVLGWTPQTSYADGLVTTLAWLRSKSRLG
jgi:nucleoside-diphosphate-sugar epimerase